MSSHEWAGRTVYLIGGGPSLRGFDFDRLQGKGIIVAINDAVRFAPFADCLVSIDTKWMNRRYGVLRGFQGESVIIVPDDYITRHRHATRLYRVNAVGISPTPGAVHTGENSGFAALGLSIMRGARTIYLLGYDMTEAGHFHAGYKWECRFGVNDYGRWSAMFSTLAVEAEARGINIINCNPDSAVRCFPFKTIDEVLSDGKVHARTLPCRSGEPGRLHAHGGAGGLEGPHLLPSVAKLSKPRVIRRRRLEASTGQ
jgi:hypothetical protein